MSPKPDDVIAGEPIEATWGNQSIRDHTVLQMASEADRDASFPAGQFGDVCYVADIQELQIVSVSDYGTEGWLEIALVEDVERAIIQALDDYLPLTGGTIHGALAVTGHVTMQGEVDLDGILETTGAFATNLYVDANGQVYKLLNPDAWNDARFLALTGGTLTDGSHIGDSAVRNFTFTDTEPASPVIGDLWIETSTKVFSYYTGSGWFGMGTLT